MIRSTPRLLATRNSKPLIDTLETLCLITGTNKRYRIYTTTDESFIEGRWDLDPIEFDTADDERVKTYLIESFWLLQISQHELQRACEVCRVPAGEIEGVVVEQLRGVLRSPEILAQAVHEVTLARPDISETEAIRHLQSIDEVWEHLFPAEQARIAHALIERITVRKDGISIKWHTKGMPKFLRDSVMQPTYREAA